MSDKWTEQEALKHALHALARIANSQPRMLKTGTFPSHIVYDMQRTAQICLRELGENS